LGFELKEEKIVAKGKKNQKLKLIEIFGES
jgi:hypothetical protein